ncbi:MMPL family transporter, partial [Allorhizocola rhizosphaerae]|uniref:MMPL family transporter n=1 Tax=Allorhizocola rhizosphaerae TaxID=1872709 RepID=UPI0013C35B72
AHPPISALPKHGDSPVMVGLMVPGGSQSQVVQRGLRRGGRIITSAALLMLVVFGSFATARLGGVEQIGLGMFAAVLIDATIVRCLLVPATMTLLGRWNWWAQHPLRRLHFRLGLRETAPEPGLLSVPAR